MIRSGLAGLALLLVCACGIPTAVAAQQARSAQVSVLQADGHYSMGNATIAVRWFVSSRGMENLVLINRLDGSEMPLGSPVSILMQDGTVYNSSNLLGAGSPLRHALVPQSDAPRAADRQHGEQLDIPLASSDGLLRVNWSVILLNGSNYVRQAVTITAIGRDAPISRVELIDVPANGAMVSGSVQGSPIVAGNYFLGLEQPHGEEQGHSRPRQGMDGTRPAIAGRAIHQVLERDRRCKSGADAT